MLNALLITCGSDAVSEINQTTKTGDKSFKRKLFFYSGMQRTGETIKADSKLCFIMAAGIMGAH